MVTDTRGAQLWLALIALLVTCTASAQNKNLAEGFTSLAKDAKIVVMPADIELFSISGGGVYEPKADWTETAIRNFRTALEQKRNKLGVVTIELNERDADEFSEINTLHAAIARAISLHHFGASSLALPTKAGKLDWSMGDTVEVIRQKTGADYALFSWLRDSYASSERIATIIVMAAFGIGLRGGSQIGYASLVELSTGRIVWFNRLERPGGDLREESKAAETLSTLLDNFPSVQQ
jgi:hypothetical protein